MQAAALSQGASNNKSEGRTEPWLFRRLQPMPTQLPS
jgi:hypothetical protein